jgi:amino acid adenylation domain-containing protein
MSEINYPTNQTGLSQEQRELLAYLLAEENIELEKVSKISPRENTHDEAPLSFAQARLLFLKELQSVGHTYNMPIAVQVKGLLNVIALKQSLNEIVQRHEALRTTFTTANQQPVQIIHPSLNLTLSEINLEHFPPNDREAKSLQIASEEAQQPFNLTELPLLRAKLLRLSPQSHILLLTMHHIISDGWSLGILVRELAAFYDAFFERKPVSLPSLTIQYADYAVWQRQRLQGEVLENLINYWKQQLAGPLPVLQLPTDRPRTVVQTFKGRKQKLQLSKSLSQAIANKSQQAGVTPFIILLTAFKILLHHYTGQEDILVGSPVANRDRAEIEDLIGLFTNTVVLRTNLDGNPTFTSLLEKVRDVVLGAYNHQELSFEKLVEILRPERNMTHTPLFGVMFVLQNAPMPALEFSGLKLHPLEIDNNTAKFDLTLDLQETSNGIEGWFEYNTDLFDASTIERMAGHLQMLLEAFVTNPEQKIDSLPLLTVKERQTLADWNQTQTDYNLDACLHQLIEAQVERSPSACSVIFEDQQLTYRELNNRANKVAHHLQKLGVKPDTLVGISMKRSLEMIIGLLGILKAGAAYVPFDPDYPTQRLAFMLEDANVPVLLTQSHLQQCFSDFKGQVIALDSDWEKIALCSADNPKLTVQADNAAYMIYTSGSTGKPKGVINTHRGICNRLLWMQDAYQLTAEDRVLQKTPFSFDVSVWEFFWTLLTGASLVVARPEGHRDSAYLVQLIAQEKITTLHFVPSMLQQFLSEDNLGVCTSLRQVICSGEALPGELQERFFTRFTDVKLYNLYGPTEAAVDVTYWACSPDGVRNVPIGRPIANTQIYILNDNLQPVPIGVIGELYIGGINLARGYHNRPGLTATKFIPNPFSVEPGARLYQTGDFARYRASGDIEYLGRRDYQVKVRGLRIELGEIEAVLNKHPEVASTTVIVREDIPGDKRLVAYVVANEHLPTVKELRAYLSDKLPDYMVPAVFIFLDTMPLTPNGKIDRRSLPIPELNLEETFIAPRNPIEEELAKIWASVLGLEQVGIAENFFELGGHSLLATQVVSRLRKIFEIELPLRSLFENPTVAGLAEVISIQLSAQKRLQIPPLQKVDQRDSLPLSFSQWRLWFLDQLTPDKGVFNMFQAFRLNGLLSVEALEKSFNEIVKRHEILRTTFITVNEQPIQVITPSLTLSIPIIEMTQLDASIEELATQEAQRSFNLSEAPLLRLCLLRLHEQEHILFLTMHHIISDHWSIGVLVEEVANLYKAFATGEPANISELPIQYADYAYWQRQWLKDDVLESQLAYWKNHLSGELPILNLPTDRPRPAIQTFNGAVQYLTLPVSLSQALQDVSVQDGNTLYMTLLSAFAALLHRSSGQSDIIIGSPVANRTHFETEKLIGFFVNTLALRIDLSGNPSYQELFRRVHKVALGAYEHQDVPFEKLIEVLQPKRDRSRAAVRQVVFAFQNAPMQPVNLPGVKITPLEIDTGTAKLDITLYMWSEGDNLKGMLEYNTDLFDTSTIARFIKQFQLLLEDIVADTQRQILTLPPLVEKPQLFKDTNPSIYESSNLAENQLLFWFAQKFQPSVQLYFANVPTTFTIKGPVDIVHFQKAFSKLIDNCDVLRSVIYEIDGIPQRQIRSHIPYQVNYADFSQHPKPNEAYQDWLQKQCLLPLNFESRLFDCSLVKIDSNQYIWFLNVHHIISDGWSTSLIAQYMSNYYRLSLEENLESVPPIPPYQDFIDYERQYRQSDAYNQAERYWKQKFSKSLNLSRFYHTDSATETTRTERISHDLGLSKSQKIRELANKLGFFSPAIIFSTVLFAYLHRVTGERIISIGTPFANRTDKFKQSIGLFMNACPLQVEIAETDTFVSLARKVQQEIIQVAKHQHYPVRNSLENRAYDVYFNYQNITFTDFCGLPMKFELIHSGHANDTLNLQVQDFDASNRFVLDFDFKCDAFNEQQRSLSVNHFLSLLDSFSPGDELIHKAKMLSPKEQQQLYEFNNTSKTYPQNKSLHNLIEEQVKKTPLSIAVIYENQQLTYQELNQRSNQLAHFLRSLGVGPDVPVGICVERSLEMVVGLLGILKAGGAYLPIDPAYPPERQTYMLDNAQVPVLLTQDKMLGLLPHQKAKTICLDSQWLEISQHSPDDLNCFTTDENLAYIIYTSGSTGKPKGVMITHAGICNRLFWMKDAYEFTSQDRVLQKTPFSFDVSVWEFFLPLMVGASLVMAQPGGHQDSAYLVQAITKYKITTIHFVPSMLQVFLDTPGLESCDSLKRVICSGEALPYQLKQRFFTSLNASLHNLYGPTEASVDVTYWSCSTQSNLQTVPIGYPIANTQLYILDQQLNQVPVGIPGELHIAGVQLARGYLNQPQLTASKFIPNPFDNIYNTNAARTKFNRLYKTGDRARYLPDGSIEYLGRLDYQVKLRGFRIELGEIEAILAKHPAIREVVLMAREDAPGNKRLVAYIVPKPGYLIIPDDVRTFLKEQLPEYMIPSAFVSLETMPLTPNGKVNRKALPIPEQVQQDKEGTFIAPRTPVEEIIANIWCQILFIEKVSIHDNFFDLGGNSLLATQLISRLRQFLEVELPLRSVFEAPTVAELALIISQHQDIKQDEKTQIMEQLLSELEQLDDEEVNNLFFSSEINT